jgi:hypothetical protein
MPSVDLTAPVIPAAGLHCLTPLYDLGSSLIGRGRRFRREVISHLSLSGGERLLNRCTTRRQ